MPAVDACGTAGLALEQIQASASCSFAAGSPWCFGEHYQETSKLKAGWTAGAGYEWAFAGNWFTRGEYCYTSLGDARASFFSSTPIDAVAAKIDTSDHRLTFGLGYRF